MRKSIMAMQTEAKPADYGYDTACDSPERGFISRQICGMTQTMREQSGRFTLVALAAGLAAGYLVGHSLASRSRGANRRTAERLGQWIMQRLDLVLPDRIVSRLHG
jgi:hypothetical protein